jgi:hypothetical protein
LILSTFTFVSSLTPAFASEADTDSALVINAATTYVQASADVPGSNLTDSFTVEAWIYRDPACTDSIGVCDFITRENTYVFGIWNGNFAYALNGASNWQWRSSGAYIPFSTWTHVALTRASAANTVSLYINGQLFSSALTADGLGTGTFNVNTNLLAIGSRSTYPSERFYGQIDEVKIWAATRSNSQILSDMHTYGPINGAGLLAYYNFNGGVAATNKSTNSPKMANLVATGTPTISDIKSLDTSSAPGYTIVKFPKSYINSNDGWTAPANVSQLSAVVVGGGGGGNSWTDNSGWVGGGGGAGGFQNLSSLNVTPGSIYSVVVGQGGFGGTTASNATSAAGNNGQDSKFSSFTSYGGGAGSGYGGGASGFAVSHATGANGGSGGGGGTYSGSGGVGTSGQGNNGGAASGACCNSGGGGGSAGTGGDGSLAVGGIGGAGTTNPYLASPAFLAAGGNGIGGSGGSNIVQNTSTSGQVISGADAGVNTGSGGGGGGGGATSRIAGDGGSGVVMIKYQNYFGASVTINVGAKKSTKVLAGNQITANTTSTGTVTFYANGRLINGCKNVAVSGTTAICNWKPLTQGQVTLTATYLSNDPLYSGSAAAPAYITTVSKRTTAR